MTLCSNYRWTSTVSVVVCGLLLVYIHYLYSSQPAALGPDSDRRLPVLPSIASGEVVDDGQHWPYRKFKSSSWMPPNISINYHGGELAKGNILFTPKARNGDEIVQSAPLIVSSDNELVYAFDASFGINDFRVQNIGGKPHLTVHQGESVLGHGYGELVILDDEYRQTNIDLSRVNKLIRPKVPKKKHPPAMADFHEFEITGRDTALITAYNNTPYDLTSIGGSENSWVVDSVFFELSIPSGEILFTWSALDHIPLNSSKLPLQSYMGDGSKKKPYDFFHLNSIQDLEAGYLINSRHMWSSYLLSKEDGHVLWQVSGSGVDGEGDFGPVPKKTTFRWQHHARAHNVTAHGLDLTLFDNHNMEDDNGTLPTRGLAIHLDLPPDSSVPPTMTRDLSPKGVQKFYAGSQGSYDAVLSNDNQLIGYGPIPVLREFGPASQGSPLLWEGRFGHDDKAQSYRAFKSSWKGTPRDWDPSLVAEAHIGEPGDEPQPSVLRGSVSWNGATDVEGWNVYVKRGRFLWESWKLAGRVERKGFETGFEMRDEGESCVRVAAVRDGEEVRMSNEVCFGD